MFTMDQYERTPLYKKPMLPGRWFYYARIPKGANYMSIGVGTESTEGMQVAHQEVGQIHRQLVEGAITDINGPITRFVMRDGPLVQRLFGDEESYRKEKTVGLHLDEREMSGLVLQSHDLAAVMTTLSQDVWGGYGAIKTLALTHGGSDVLGYYYNADDRSIIIGTYSAANGLREAARLYQNNGRQIATAFYCRAADLRLFLSGNANPGLIRGGYGYRTQSVTMTDKEYQTLAIELVRLADKVWATHPTIGD